jgi:hypothetical protein
MSPLLRYLAGLVAVAALSSACGGAAASFGDDAFAVRANSDLGMGRDRLLVGIGNDGGARLGSPDDSVTLEVAPVDDPASVQRAPGVWTWIVPDVTGLYRAEFDFDRPGTWTVTVVPETGAPLEAVPFLVAADPFAPAIGEQAPVVPTPTLDDLPLERLTTDPTPYPAFYELSLDEALANGRTTVLVFSTPAYCVTAACGPLLDTVQQVAPDYPEANFIHVEVYTDFWTEGFVPGVAFIAPSAGPGGFNLVSEPWVFVIDPAGRIVARLEGVMAPEELVSLLG